MTMNVAVSGVKAATADLNTIAHNIANVGTTGFKNSRAEFADLVGGSGSSGLLGVQTQAVNQLFRQGSIVSTSNDGNYSKLDLAINGNGFFQVKNVTGGELLYTRAGSFEIDKDGFVINDMGQRLQGVTGDIQFQGTGGWGNVSIASDGTITATDSTGTPVVTAPATQLGLVDFPSVQGLKAVGDTQWIETAASGAATAIAAPGTGILGKVKVGYLEASNSDLTDQLVNMINAQRNFQANAKTITTENTLSETVINIR